MEIFGPLVYSLLLDLVVTECHVKIHCSRSNLYRFKYDLSKLTYLSKLVIDVLRVIVTF